MFTPITVPSRSSPETFATEAELAIAGLAQFILDYNQLGSILNTAITSTSTTSLAIGTGSKSLTVQTGLNLVPGYPVRLAYTTTPTNNMDGTVTTYDSSTGALVVYVASINGSGTFANWQVMVLPSATGNFADKSTENIFTLLQTFSSGIIVPDDAYDSSEWNSDLSVPTKNAVRDKFESLIKNIVDSGTAVKINRQNSTDEGGQLEFARAVDNATGFFLDVAGNDTLPIFRVVAKNYANSGAESVIKQSDSYGAESSPIVGASGLYPEFKCRGFCKFNGISPVSISVGSGNILGVSRISTGEYEVTLTVSMPDQGFSCPGSAIRTDSTNNTTSFNAYPIANNKIKVFINRFAGGANERVDCDVISLSIFR